MSCPISKYCTNKGDKCDNCTFNIKPINHFNPINRLEIIGCGDPNGGYIYCSECMRDQFDEVCIFCLETENTEVFFSITELENKRRGK